MTSYHRVADVSKKRDAFIFSVERPKKTLEAEVTMFLRNVGKWMPATPRHIPTLPWKTRIVATGMMRVLATVEEYSRMFCKSSGIKCDSWISEDVEINGVLLFPYDFDDWHRVVLLSSFDTNTGWVSTQVLLYFNCQTTCFAPIHATS